MTVVEWPAPCETGESAITVTVVTPGGDEARAVAVLEEQRQWLASIGVNVFVVQLTAKLEYQQPTTYYADGCLLLADVDGEAAGIVGLKPLTGEVVEVRHMFVSSWARGHGVGRALMAAALDQAHLLGFRQVQLEPAS
jgi:predicted GNAT family acetyltransferase